jgi:transcriptional regulator with GAF, ATPase, and Fis domain
LGSTKTIRVNVRLIAATHRDLESMIRNNECLGLKKTTLQNKMRKLNISRGDYSA